MKEIKWLSDFAVEQAAKLQKTASLNKKAAQIIVNCDDVPGACNGQEVTYKNEKYTVVDASFQDEAGAGIVLEKLGEGEEVVDGGEEVTAGLEDIKKDEEAPAEEGAEEEVKEEVPAVEENAEEVPATEAPATDAPVAAPAMGGGVMPGTESPSSAAQPFPIAPSDTTVPGNLDPVAINGQPIGTQQKVTDSPERARTNPGDVYDIGDVRDSVEPAKFNGEANETAQQIAQENSVDRSVMENRTPNRIFNRMMTDFQAQQPATEAPVEEDEDLKELDLPNEEAPATEAPVAEEAPAEEEVVEEEPAVEEKPEMAEEMGTEEEEKKEDKFAKNKILRKILSGK